LRSGGTDSVAFFGPSGDNKFGYGAFHRGGDLLYVGNRTQPAIVIIDMTTLSPVIGVDLSGGGGIAFDGTGSIGWVSDVQLSPGRKQEFLYAVVNTGTHGGSVAGFGFPPGGGTSGTDVVRLDRLTLAEVDRVSLVSGLGFEAGGRDLSQSKDGNTGAVPVQGAGLVFLLDLNPMGVITSFDVSTTSIQPMEVALSPDASTIYVSHRGNDGTLDVIDVAGGTITPLAPPTLLFNNPGQLDFGPDGRLYYIRLGNVSVYNPRTTTWTEVSASINARALAFSRGTYYVIDKNGTIFPFDTATDAPATAEATGATSIPTGGGAAHGLALSRS
ncbi:MAG: hypothetical protein O7B99_03320, partial [Planctomycetota bacterium]|nr:hypothetical protein [Planctomycetota bacterium]